jgi:glutamyl-tRNA reductase
MFGYPYLPIGPEYVRGNTHPADDRRSDMSTESLEAAPDRTEATHDRSEPSLDAEQLRRQFRRQTAEIERCELEEAISKLDARGDLSDEQRETVRELGAALVEGLTDAPEQALERAERSERTGERERERARAIRRLFDIDEA